MSTPFEPVLKSSAEERADPLREGEPQGFWERAVSRINSRIEEFPRLYRGLVMGKFDS
jgi:hypothetical protein